MSKRVYLSVICCLFATQALAVSQGYIDGQAAAVNSLGNTAGGVTQTNVDGVGNPYGGNTTTLQNTFGTSNTNNTGLYSNGQQQVADCKTIPPNSPPNVLQYCAGVNALALNPLQNARNQTGLTKADPIFTNPNNGYNLGLAGAGTTPTTVGSGTAQGGVIGAASCVTTTGATPPVYTTTNCDRAAGASTQLCTKTILPSVTTTPYCNISGTAYVYAISEFASFYGVTNLNGATALYKIDFSCANFATGQAVIQQYLPLWGPSYTCNYIPGWCPFSGTINTNYPVGTVYFAPGATTVPVTWASMVNYDGTVYNNTTAWYDGPSGKIIVNNSIGVTTGWAAASCPANYTWVDPIVIGKIVTVTGMTTMCSTSSGSTTGYCTNPTDLTSVEMLPAAQSKLPGTCTVIGTKYQCSPNPGGTIGKTNTCKTKGACYYLSNICDVNHVLVTSCVTKTSVCYPKNLHVLPYAPAATSNAGSCGINHNLTATVSNTCTTLQAQTPFPTAYPATSVNGVYTCPTGMTVSGSNCI